MPALPDPNDLREPARSTQRPIDDRSWRRYQRYLRTLMQQRRYSYNKQPPAFEEVCVEQKNQEICNKPL